MSPVDPTRPWSVISSVGTSCTFSRLKWSREKMTRSWRLSQQTYLQVLRMATPTTANLGKLYWACAAMTCRWTALTRSLWFASGTRLQSSMMSWTGNKCCPWALSLRISTHHNLVRRNKTGRKEYQEITARNFWTHSWSPLCIRTLIARLTSSASGPLTRPSSWTSCSTPRNHSHWIRDFRSWWPRKTWTMSCHSLKY